MKRSEMIEKLEVYIEFLKDFPLADSKEYSTCILDRLEEFGMLPPLAKFKDAGHFPGDEFEYEFYEWEEEV